MSTEAPDTPEPSILPELRTFRAEVLSRKELPTIPVVLGRILAITESERSSTKDLVEIIEHDQALMGRILRLANSALFGLSRDVATIPRAIVLVGFNTVRNLALGVKIWDTLAVGGRQRVMIESLWNHSAIVAATAKRVASRVHGVDPDTCFTAGLLHDVGRLVLSLKLGMRYWTLVEAADAEQPVEQIERSQLGVDHAEAGGWLIDSWRLPPPIVAAIRDHHDPSAHPADGWSPARVVYAANRLVHGTDFDSGEVEALAVGILEQTAACGFTEDVWASVFAELRAEADAVSGFFRGP